MARTAQRAPTRRRQAPVTRAFLFCDLSGYTDFVERKGDAAAARLLKDYRTLVRREVARHEGAEVTTEGDSFYVVFDSASAALDCSVAILRRAAARLAVASSPVTRRAARGPWSRSATSGPAAEPASRAISRSRSC